MNSYKLLAKLLLPTLCFLNDHKITKKKQLQVKQFVERPQKILGNYVHIS